MRKQTHSSTIRNSAAIFLLCLAVHAFEVLVLRTDETFFAECFINKVFGIVLLYAVLRKLNWRWSDIGFVRQKLPAGAFKGFVLCAVCYSIAFASELLILSARGTPAHVEFFAAGFSLTGGAAKQTGLGFVLMCVGFNVINVWMEEGLFRGFLITYIGRSHSGKAALYVPALLFGLWHIVTPLRSLLDGEISAGVFAVMGAGYVVLSGMMGIKWGLLYRLSGAVWIGLADHFFNNCAATNLLHVVTAEGVDEFQIIRVLIGELLSFAVVAVYSRVRQAKS